MLTGLVSSTSIAAHIRLARHRARDIRDYLSGTSLFHDEEEARTMTKILADIERAVRPGMVIPKPKAKGDFLVKGWGGRRGERALIYTIPNHKTPTKPFEKGITTSEWKRAFAHLIDTGDFNRSWFNRSMPACA
jgi:hypothetical protein